LNAWTFWICAYFDEMHGYNIYLPFLVRSALLFFFRTFIVSIRTQVQKFASGRRLTGKKLPMCRGQDPARASPGKSPWAGGMDQAGEVRSGQARQKAGPARSPVAQVWARGQQRGQVPFQVNPAKQVCTAGCPAQLRVHCQRHSRSASCQINGFH